MSEVTDQHNEQTMDRKDLKILAYKEKVAELEERVVDLRVEVTLLSNQLMEANAKAQSVEEVADEQSPEPEETPEA